MRGDVLVGQLAVGAVDELAELAGVDEEHLAAAVTERAVLAIAREEPQAGGDLGRVEELAGQRDHAVDEVGFDQGLADLALAGLVRRHRAVGEHEAGHARWREVVDDVLHPGEVGRCPWVARRSASACRHCRRSPPQSEMLKGGLARMKSALRSGWRSVVEAVAVADLAVDAADGGGSSWRAARWCSSTPAPRSRCPASSP